MHMDMITLLVGNQIQLGIYSILKGKLLIEDPHQVSCACVVTHS